MAVGAPWARSAEALAIPVEESAHAVFYLHLVGPAQRVEFGHVDELAHGAVGAGSVEVDGAFKSYSFGHEMGELADGELLARAHIDVAVAYLAQFGDGSAATLGVVAVYAAVGLGAIEHGAVAVYAYDVAEVDMEQHVDAGVGHVFAPEKLAQRRACAPEYHAVVVDAVVGERTENAVGLAVAVYVALADDVAQGVGGVDGALVHIAGNAVPVALVDELGEVDLTHHGWHDMRIFEVEVVVGSIEIGGHHSDEVGAVLEIVGLAHLESGYLGDGILLVGVLQGRREQTVLAVR